MRERASQHGVTLKWISGLLDLYLLAELDDAYVFILLKFSRETARIKLRIFLSVSVPLRGGEEYWSFS